MILKSRGGVFTTRRVGTTGHDSDGIVVAWAADGAWATMIAFLLNRLEAEGLGQPAWNRRGGRCRASKNSAWPTSRSAVGSES
jgi:hypothetical protein